MRKAGGFRVEPDALVVGHPAHIASRKIRADAGAAHPGIVVLPVEQFEFAGCRVELHDPAVFVVQRACYNHRFAVF